jgi:uncharacterized protein YjbJ (UPF0337 family)
MVDENRFEGTARRVGGRIQEAVGDFAGDASSQIRGRANEAVGAAQQAYGTVSDEARAYADQLSDTVKEQPLVALAIAGGVGFLLGLIVRR